MVTAETIFLPNELTNQTSPSNYYFKIYTQTTNGDL